MSTHEESDLLFRRVNRFARLSIYAAVLMALVSLVYSVVDMKATSVYAALSNERYDGVREILAVATRFSSEGLASALYLVGIAILALLVARIAAGPRRDWAPRLDEQFVKTARIVSAVIIVYALLFALYVCINTAQIGALALHAWRHRGAGNGSEWRAISIAGGGLHSLAAGLTRFFIYVLGAHVIRMLLLMTPGDDPGAARPEGAGQ